MNKRKQSSWALAKRIMGYFGPYKFRICIALVAMVFVAITTAGTAFLVKPTLDKIFIEKNSNALYWVPICLIIVYAIKGFSTFLQRYMLQYCGLKVLEKLRNELFEKMICLPLTYFGETRTGLLLSHIIADVDQIRQSLPTFIQTARGFLTIIALMAVVLYRDASLAFWALLVLPLIIYPLVAFGIKLRRNGRQMQRKLADTAVYLTEIFGGVRVVKAFATEDDESAKFAKVNNELANTAIQGVFYSQIASPMMEIIGSLGIGAVIWYGGKEVIAGTTTVGSLFSFLAALMLMYEPLKELGRSNAAIQQAMAGAERVFEILDGESAIMEVTGALPLVEPISSLEMQNVTFSYYKASEPALRNISFSVKTSERIALVGSSGGGKSTLASLVTRFFDPQFGKIWINGHDIREYKLDDLRRTIGVVSQDPFLFNTSVRENIAYGMPFATGDDIIAAAKAAYAHDFICELENSYDTMIGERGVKISGGQKQRLTIARAILKNPSLLILDEATSALDAESERYVQQALDNLMSGRTSIVIAHRLSTIIDATRIIVIDRGEIVGVGNHQELLNSNSIYKTLYHMQFSAVQVN